ncbi:Eco57I restriction-modification methylase domain-containing protein [Planctomycetaceae bacterium SH139]
MASLPSDLRRKLEKAVVEARDVAEAGARDALQALTVHEAKRGDHVSGESAELRNRLRAHARQLGDARAANGSQQIDRLVAECAYEHWHRMLFARFLAENDLLIEPHSGVAVSLADVEELATEEGCNLWELAASFATRMLPQIFRVDNPVLAVALPSETRLKLEEVLESLPVDVFTASDSLGWVYQFWQSNEKDRINDSEVKIGARELPAVTQLFTEPYMVSFLLDNSLGAWWAGKRLTEEDLRTAESEQELRDKAALPGVPLSYLRFVRASQADPQCDAGGPENASSSDDAASSKDNPWRIAAGTFSSWPDSLAELKTLDPCCGSGHFLVGALLMLTPMRMELDRLSSHEAVDRVLSENLYGLEIDQRCVELAAFALALAAWQFPASGGYRPLPELNLACCGLSVSIPREEWKKLAGDNDQLRIALDWMYDELRNAPVLGSLLNPAKSMGAKVVEWENLEPLIELALAKEVTDESSEAVVVAQGLLRAARILSRTYTHVITNVPYLGNGKQHGILRAYIEQHLTNGKADLATAFVLRCLDLSDENGTVTFVSPQNWWFLASYESFRRAVLKSTKWHYAIALGEEAWQIFGNRGPRTTLVSFSKCMPSGTDQFAALDVSSEYGDDVVTFDQKLCLLQGTASDRDHEVRFDLSSLQQCEQLDNPASRIVLSVTARGSYLSEYVTCGEGSSTGDNGRYVRQFWELSHRTRDWINYAGGDGASRSWHGRDLWIQWEDGEGELSRSEGARIQNTHLWNGTGVLIGRIRGITCTRFSGGSFDKACVAVCPRQSEWLAPLYSFLSSSEYESAVRQIDQKVAASTSAMTSVVFDLPHWEQVATEKFPYDLPEPYVDDPTQWIFHGHPADCSDALQVAVARLLGYRWPAELDESMELAADARAWTECSRELTDLADNDGIVCIPAVGTEGPAADRLFEVLRRAFDDGKRMEAKLQQHLDAGDSDERLTRALLQRHWKPLLPKDFNQWLSDVLKQASHAGKSLETWLRDKFFDQHCKRFNNRPFIWHVWDGCKDGFSALVNYHELAGPNGRRVLEKLTHSYLGAWITRQQDEVNREAEGADARLIAAKELKTRLEAILKGEPPYDIFVRWKPLHEQPIGWQPDLNDGVRLNIRPFMCRDIPGGKKGAGILRGKPNIKWTKDRGKEVDKPKVDFPWLWSWDEETVDFAGGDDFDKNRWNDCHYTNAFKQTARDSAALNAANHTPTEEVV